MKTRLLKKLRKLAKKNIYIMDCPNEIHRYKLVSETNIVQISMIEDCWPNLKPAIDKCNRLRNYFILYIVREKKTKIIY